jgi:hypothetical protein
MRRPVPRIAIYLVGAVLVMGGMLLALVGCGLAVVAGWLVVWGLVLVVGLAIERWHYKPVTDARPGPEWQATDERFVDPESGRLVRVYFHPQTGERRYVAA